MKEITIIEVSFYQNVYSRNPKKVTIGQIIKAIREGKYKNQVNLIRQFNKIGEKTTAQNVKKELPCFTIGGVFNGPHAISCLEKYSGLLLIDFDHVPDVGKMREICINDPHTVLAFASPTDGYKVAAYVENAVNNHRKAYQIVADYYSALTGEKADPACKDESRLSFVSYDPQAYVAAFYTPFAIDVHTENEEEKTVLDDDFDLTDEKDPVKCFLEYLDDFIQREPITPGNRNQSLFKLACKACQMHLSKETVFTYISPFFISLDFTENEIKRTLESGYKRVSSDSAKHEGDSEKAQKLKSSKAHYETISDEDLEEKYWEGEDLRRSTPSIPDDVFEKLPPFLKSCLNIDLNNCRERDMLLLSCITALSAAMPQCRFVYNGRIYSPHLYFFGIAPAGSGKGVVQFSFKLLESIHEMIKEKSKRKRKEYKRKKAEWDRLCAQKRKEGLPINMDEAPIEPSLQFFVTPCQTSHSRLETQLRDNGDLGIVIFDTEAQTLANANQQDYGHFDDILCKAFGHETISSSYKINGDPIEVKNPRVSIVITGTTDQLLCVVVNPGNGLPSRTLYYTFRLNPVWHDVRPRNGAVSLDEYFENLGKEVLQMYEFFLKNKTLFNCTQEQWDRINNTFEKLLKDTALESNDELQAVVKRYALMTVRIASVFTMLRKFERKDVEKYQMCSDEDCDSAISITLTCYEHAKLLINSLPAGKRVSLLKNNAKRAFFDAMPDCFTSQDVQKYVKTNGLSISTVKRYIKSLIELKINKISHGKYEKIGD